MPVMMDPQAASAALSAQYRSPNDPLSNLLGRMAQPNSPAPLIPPEAEPFFSQDDKRRLGLDVLRKRMIGIDPTTGPYNDSPTDQQRLRDLNDPTKPSIQHLKGVEEGMEHRLEDLPMMKALMGAEPTPTQNIGEVVPFPQTIEGMHNDLLGRTGPSTVDRKLQSSLIRQSPENVAGAINSGGRGVAIGGVDPNGMFIIRPVVRGGGSSGGGFFPPKM